AQWLDSPPVGSVITFNPPSIEDAEVQHAVQGGFHAAGAAGLHRKARSVQPNVDALDEILRHMHFIIFNESDAAAQFVIMAEVQHLMNEVSTRLIGWMGLAGEDELDRPPAVLEESLQPFQVSEEQGGPLIRREPSGESNGQRFGVQECAACEDLRGLQVAMHPAGS